MISGADNRLRRRKQLPVNREIETWVCNDCAHLVPKTRKYCHQCGSDEPNYDYLIEQRVSDITGMARNPYKHHTDDN